MEGLDETNCKILNLLQKDCRMSLTKIAQEINLSVDSTKKRIEKLREKGIFSPTVQIKPRKLGYPDIVDVKIKLRDYNEENVKRFIQYCVEHPRIAEVFSLSGEWDFTIVIFSKNHEELGMITDEIRQNFGHMFNSWSESLTKIAYKFEKYDLLKLKEYERERK